MLFLLCVAAGVYVGIGLGVVLSALVDLQQWGDWPYVILAAVLMVPLWPLAFLGDWLDIPDY